jgi:hypothetical protein
VEDEPKPVDMTAWADYVRAGRAHFERVERSWTVFARTARELIGLLHSVETDALSSLRLMQDPSGGSEEAKFHREFWAQLDQRLHNMLSGAVSLVDHTRPLVRFYPHEYAFTGEYAARSGKVADSPRASFLRKLRNYLLHYGMAPLMHTMRLEDVAVEDWDHLEIQLSPDALLAWPDWNASQRKFIRECQPGPPLRKLAVGYAEDMEELYTWLLQQYSVLHVPGVVPAHLA